MRNKRSNKILYTNKKTGEFIASRRFNSQDYILTSIFDSEYENESNKSYAINESFLDEISDDETWGEYVDDSYVESKPCIPIRNTAGIDVDVDYIDDNDIVNGFGVYIHSMLILDDELSKEQLNIGDIIKMSGINKSCRVKFNDVSFQYGQIKYIIGGKKKYSGFLELQYSDERCNNVNIIVYSDNPKVGFGYHNSFASMTYEHFRIYNREEDLFSKNVEEYYSTLISNLIPMFNENGMNITYTSKRSEKPINYKYFTTPKVDAGFVQSKLKPVCIYSPVKQPDINIILNGVRDDIKLINNVYYMNNDFSSSDLKEDEHYVIIAQAKKFFNRLFKGFYMTSGLIDKDNMVKMTWFADNNEQKYALAMPLSIFMLYSPIFYMMLSNDPIV